MESTLTRFSVRIKIKPFSHCAASFSRAPAHNREDILPLAIQLRRVFYHDNIIRGFSICLSVHALCYYPKFVALWIYETVDEVASAEALVFRTFHPPEWYISGVTYNYFLFPFGSTNKQTNSDDRNVYVRQEGIQNSRCSATVCHFSHKLM